MPTALIIDPCDAFRRQLAGWLTGLGFQVDGISDSNVAMDCLAQHVPDLICLEWDLSPHSGESLLPCIRDDPRTVRVPAFVIAAVASRSAIMRAGLLGIQGYLKKPCQSHELVTRLMQHGLIDAAPHATRSPFGLARRRYSSSAHEPA